ncbi:MAG TPA: hypothetical protein DDX04_12100, partial [Massilia sp.]|nr:hypothetical protein [Massilia sp.]
MILTNKYVWIGAGVGLLAAVYLGSKAVDVVADVAESVNPFNNENIFNLGATELYQFLSGSTGSIGTDFYDFMHKAEPVPDGSGKLINYTTEQQKRDEEAM